MSSHNHRAPVSSAAPSCCYLACIHRRVTIPLLLPLKELSSNPGGESISNLIGTLAVKVIFFLSGCGGSRQTVLDVVKAYANQRVNPV